MMYQSNYTRYVIFVLCLSLYLTKPSFAQQRARFNERNRSGDNVTERMERDNSEPKDNLSFPKMNPFFLMRSLTRTREEIVDSDKNTDISKLILALVENLAKADTNKDGLLSLDEQQSIQESDMPPERRDSDSKNGEGRNRRDSQDSEMTSEHPRDFNMPPDGGRPPFLRGEGEPNNWGSGNFVPPPQVSTNNDFFAVIFETVDQNTGSLEISKFESNLKSFLEKADTNKDSKLGEDEWRALFGMNFDRRGDMGRMRAFAVSMLQRQVIESSLSEENSNLDIAKFRSEYARLLKEVDSDSNGSLNEKELQVLQEKNRESFFGRGGSSEGRPPMPGFEREREEGFNNPNGENNTPLPFGGRDPFEQMKGENGSVDISKFENAPFYEEMEKTDKDKDGFLNEDEFKTFRSAIDSNRGGRRKGDWESDNRQDDNSENRRRENRRQPSSNRSDGSIRNNNSGMGEERFGNEPRGPMMMRGGFPDGGARNGMFMMRRNDGVIQKIIEKSTQEGVFNITKFDSFLVQELTNADNDDDGFLDKDEQKDAFGREINPFSGDRPRRVQPVERERVQRPRNSSNTERQRPSQEPQNGDLRMQAFRVPIPDDSFVGVLGNKSFKFSKKRNTVDSDGIVPIEKDYAMGKYEVRNREYKDFIDATNRQELPKYWKEGSYSKGMKNCPVVGITVADAEAYCEWLSTKYQGWKFRLPTEAEFENAAAGTKGLRYPWGGNAGTSYSKKKIVSKCLYNAVVVADLIAADATIKVDDQDKKVVDLVNISAKGIITEGWRDTEKKKGFTYSDVFLAKVKEGGFVVPVYKYDEDESPFGCIGMAGNANEWTSDVIDGKNVVRGGSWYSSIEDCAATSRGELKDPSKGYPTVGFRVVAEQEATNLILPSNDSQNKSEK